MAIVKFPSGMTIPHTVTCILCDRHISPADAVTGQLDANQNPAFACSGHFWDTSILICGWASFNHAQGLALERRGMPVHYFTGMDSHHA